MSKTKALIGGIGALPIVLLGGSFAARRRFNRKVDREVEALFEKVGSTDRKISEENLDGLPDAVRRWLENSGVMDRGDIKAVRLKQNAEMRLAEGKPWMPVRAEQYFIPHQPGFIWKADIRMAPFLHISGRDKYDDARGNMLIKVLSLFTAADSSGPEIDQGTMLRYLAEMIWFPSAALNDYIIWTTIDDNNAEATMTYGDVSATGVFTFNSQGDPTHFEAERYGDFDGEMRLETWAIPLKSYREFEGVRVPTEGEVTWKLDSGDFNWFNFEVVEIEYDNPHPYHSR